MDNSEKQLEEIFDFLQESAAKQYDISDARARLGQLKYDAGSSAASFPEKMNKIYLSAAWMLPGNKCGKYEIPAELRSLWNQFIQKILSPAAEYHYTCENSYQTDLLKLHTGFKIIQESEESTESQNDFHLQDRISAVSTKFVGRESLIHEIHERLHSDSRILVLYGFGGIGKSELAKAYANRYASCYHTVVFCHFHESLQETLIDDCQISVKHLAFRSTGKRGERGWYFRRKLKILRQLVNENTLLIIDNFDVLADERLHAITSLPCKILFTSRTDPSAFSLPGIRIPVLPPEVQKALFFAYYEKELSSSELIQLEKLLAFLCGHTLSIKLCASYLAESGGSVARLLSRLQDEKSSKDAEIHTQIQSIFRISSLGKEERAILRFLSVMPLYGIKLEKFIEWCRIDDTSKIEKLVNRGFIEWNEQDKQLSLHPLIIRTIRQTESVSFRNCWPYTQTMCMLSDQTWGKTAEEMKEYEKYLYTFVVTLMDSEKEPFSDLIYLVSGCWQLGYYSEAVQLGLNLYQYCQEKYADNSTEAANIRHRIGEAYDNWGKSSIAGKWYRLAYEGYMECENPHPFFYSLICHKYGRALLYDHCLEKSEKILLKAQKHLHHALLKNVQTVDVGYTENLGWGALMDIYMELADLYLEWGKPETALKWLKRREKEFQEQKLYLSRPTSQWHLYYVMGLCQMRLGNLDDSEDALYQSLSFAQKYFITDSPFICSILGAFGELMLKKGNISAAQEWFHRKRTLEKKRILHDRSTN